MDAIHLQVPVHFSVPHTSSIKHSLNTPRPKVIYLLILDSSKVAKLEEAVIKGYILQKYLNRNLSR